MEKVTRRSFVGGVAAAFGGIVLPVSAFASDKKPILRFGVASDAHVCLYWDQSPCLERVFRWFDAEKVDAVVFPGDMVHTGNAKELEIFAASWNKVFPGCRGSDGRTVEHLFVTGNHEVCQWPGLWDKYSDEELQKIRLDYDLPHMKATWRRLFGEDFELVWKREVKGVTFIGAQYDELHPDAAGFMRRHGRELDPKKPFFFIQHGHPKHTCYGETAKWNCSQIDTQDILSAFPNAVAITGHSHFSPCDERSVWQGAFTSVCTSCPRTATSSSRSRRATATACPARR